MNYIDELKGYITSHSSLVFGTNLFIGKLPDTLTSVIAIQKSTSEYNYSYGNKFGYSEENTIIRIRGTQVENATRALATTMETVLENLTNVSLTNYRIVRGWFSTPLYQLEGTDANNNFIYIGVYTSILERI